MVVILGFIYFLLFVALSYRSDKLALALLAGLLPTYGLRFSVFGVPSTFLEVSIWAVAVVWFYKQWRLYGFPRWPSVIEASSEKNPFALYLWPILFWILAATLSAAISPNPVTALGIWKAYFIDPLLVFVLVVVVFRGTKERWWLICALGIVVIALGLIAWYQKFSGQWLPEPWAATLPLRVTSWYSYPNAVGLFAAPIVAIFFVLFLYQVKYYFSSENYSNILKNIGIPLSVSLSAMTFNLAVFILGSGAIIFAVSKGAWVGLAAGASFGALLVFKNYWRLTLVGLLFLILLFLFIPPVRNPLFNEFAFRSPSGKMRLVVWEETLTLLKGHPIAGAGLAGYQTALQPYHQDWRKDISPYKLEIFLYPHNVFLNFWAELGLFGLIVFIWLMIAFGKMVWQNRSRPFTQLAAAAMITLLVHGLVDVPYFKNDLAVLFWLIMALPLLDLPSALSDNQTV